MNGKSTPTTILHIRMPNYLRDIIKARAKKAVRSMHTEILVLLHKATKEKIQ